MRLLNVIWLFSVLLVSASSATAQDSPEILPQVVQHAEPVYPAIARVAHISGDVLVKVTTDGESVVDAKAETGPPMLIKAAEDNVRTWKFAAHTPRTFHVTYRYKFLSGGVEISFLKTPAVIEIEAPPAELSINWSWVGLGKWKALLKSAHGNSQQVFELRFSGPGDKWLDGTASGPNGEREDIDFGYFDFKEGITDSLLGFTVKLKQSDGQQVTTFVVGKIIGDKIVGTFVDDAGIVGQWTAVRER